MTRSHRLPVVAGTLVIIASMTVAPAWAYWKSTGFGTGTAKTDSMQPGNTPTASVGAAQSVVVSWSASTTTSGRPDRKSVV